MSQSETEVARPVVQYLQHLHWDVHQEVQVGAGGARADIVGTMPRPSGTAMLWVVEVKRSLTFALIAQAAGWLDQAHYVSLAVPSTRTGGGDGRRMAYRYCASLGIGVIEVTVDRGDGAVRVEVAAKIGRRRMIPALRDRLARALCDETRTFATAGNAESRYWSPFRATCREIQRVLTERGPLTTRELVDAIDHHYAHDASARSTLPTWLAQGKIPGVESDGGKPWRWRLSTTRGSA